jgi:hypothetical protein
MAKSFKINAEGDLNIPFQFVSDEVELVQRIKIALLTYKGEFFANTELGVDYYNTIFERVPNLASFKDSVIRVLSGFEEILKINKIDISKYNSTDYRLSVDVSTSYQENLQIEV